MKKIRSQRSDLSLAAVQDGRNEDLLRKIFLRLPARYLLKFKVVSKQWSALSSDPQFIRDYYKSSTPSGLYFYNSLNASDIKCEEIESVSLDGGPNQSSGIGVPSLSFLDSISPGCVIKILQSCHGLLLCELTYCSSPDVVGELCVCNPTTRKHKLIPQPSLQPRESIAAISLAFDPSESLHYKLVCVKSIYSYNGCTRYLEVYSSETGSWKHASCSVRRYDMPLFENAFYWNNTIHWVSSEVGHKCLFDKFDSTENVKIICLPGPREKIRYFSVSPGYWHIMYIPSFSAHRFNILEMNINTFKWSVKYKVNIYPLLSVFPEIVRYTGPDLDCDADGRDRVYAFSILSFIQGEKDVDSELVLLIPGKVVSYNLRQKTVKVLRELPYQFADTSSFGFINSHQFVDSLFPV